MADFDEFFVDELHAALGGYFEEFDLRLHKKIESEFGDEKGRSRAGGIADCRSDVKGREVLRGIDGFKTVAEDGIEDVVDACAAAEVFCADFCRGAVY